jgi:hypothetical protein
MMWSIVFALSLLWIQAGGSLGDVPNNLLIDPRADLGGAAWRSVGEASIEQRDGSRRFAGSGRRVRG